MVPVMDININAFILREVLQLFISTVYASVRFTLQRI